MSVLNRASSSTVLPDAACALRPSACPGLARIVAARDGGICRIKLPGGELSAAQADAIAQVSARHAAGVIELTNRANLQLRGVRGGEEAALSAALVDARLGPLPEAEGEARLDALAADDIRNVMISPTAGRDPCALFDTRPLCAALLALLQGDTRFAALSPKFALLVDGGERLARLDHPHDLWLAAAQDGSGEIRFVFGLAGCPPAGATESAARAATQAAVSAATGAATGGLANAPASSRAQARANAPARSTTSAAGDAAANAAVNAAVNAATNAPPNAPPANPQGALAAVLPSQVPALVRALLYTFLDLAAADATRMRHLLAAHPVDAILQHAQTYVDFPLTRDAALADWRRSMPADAGLRVGAHGERIAGTWHVGGQPLLGRIDAHILHALASLARQHGNGTLRITPWQSVLLPAIGTQAVPAVLAALKKLGLACDPHDPATRLIACAGSSGCAKSLADTKADARALAKHLPAGLDVHLSGCPRSCAAAHCAPFTLLAAAPGVYDLYRRDARPGFGECVARQLTIGQAAATLARLARSEPMHDPDE
ncbi:oxidoreductase [Paraburkholderia phenoliruptrix]|uniref:Oxidoreductase n=1 Tax=Paraburkholderia phenoliruptrix TaxID=252970 RepID=A0ABV3W608_9BURK